MPNRIDFKTIDMDLSDIGDCRFCGGKLEMVQKDEDRTTSYAVCCSQYEDDGTPGGDACPLNFTEGSFWFPRKIEAIRYYQEWQVFFATRQTKKKPARANRS